MSGALGYGTSGLVVENVGAPHGHVCALPAQETYSGGGRDDRWFIYLAETLLPPACPFIFRPTCMTIPDVRAFLIPPSRRKKGREQSSFLPYRRDSDREWPLLSIGSIRLFARAP